MQGCSSILDIASSGLLPPAQWTVSYVHTWARLRRTWQIPTLGCLSLWVLQPAYEIYYKFTWHWKLQCWCRSQICASRLSEFLPQYVHILHGSQHWRGISSSLQPTRGCSVLEIIVQVTLHEAMFPHIKRTNNIHQPSHWSAVVDSDFAEGFSALASSKWNPGEALLIRMVKNDVIVKCSDPHVFSFRPVNSFKDLQNLSCCCMPMATTCQANQYGGLLSSQSVRTRRFCCKKLPKLFPRKVPQLLLYCFVRYPTCMIAFASDVRLGCLAVVIAQLTTAAP